MIEAALAFLIKPFGRWAAIAAMVFAWFAFASHYEKQGASRVTAKIEKAVAVNAEKANEVRNRVRSIPADKLTDKFTRD